jgi:hypothetical protein
MKSFSLPLLFLFLLSFLFSCARIQTLNLQPHNYSERPNHIIWIQLAGFSEEHLPLLRFNNSDASLKTSLEQVDCVGKMWSFNLYNLRPEADKSFLAQITGSKNIRGTCEDHASKPAWAYLENIGYKIGILESGTKKSQSLESSLLCPESKTLDLSKMHYWKMASDVPTGQKSFHYQDSPKDLEASITPGLYYDRSCQKERCYSTISNNFKTLWSLLRKEKPKTFFLIRDFSFQNALLKKDINLAKDSLLEIDRLVASIDQTAFSDVLIIVSGAESLPLEFPLQGKEWADFYKSGKNVIYKNSSLMSPVLAVGAMSENFCGIFDESEMLKRVIYKPEEKVFNAELINPF